MKTLKQFREANLSTLGSSSAVSNANRNYLPDTLSKASNPNTTSSRAEPNSARPRSFDATPDRQANLTRGYFNANLGNKMGARIDTTDNNKLGIK